MTDAAGFLDTPLGQPGSGRVRYGAAMELWRAGKISSEVLEVYRVAAAHDGRDPRAILRERGLPVPDSPVKADSIRHLYAAVRDYLLALDHPGAAEVRAGLPTDPGPMQPPKARQTAVVERWLDVALAAVAQDRPSLSATIADAAAQLEWTTYDAYDPDEIGADFASGHAFAAIMGEGAPFAAEDFDMGLFLVAPGLLYRDHSHRAPELYAPLTGPHGWRFGLGRALVVKPAHQPVWNPPHQPHLTKVGRTPFLGFYVWTQDVNDPARVLAADDWAKLESFDIG